MQRASAKYSVDPNPFDVFETQVKRTGLWVLCVCVFVSLYLWINKKKNKLVKCLSVCHAESDGVVCFMGKLKGLLKGERWASLVWCVCVSLCKCVCVCFLSLQYQSLLLDFRALLLASRLLAMPWNGFSLDHYPYQCTTVLPQPFVSERKCVKVGLEGGKNVFLVVYIRALVFATLRLCLFLYVAKMSCVNMLVSRCVCVRLRVRRK